MKGILFHNDKSTIKAELLRLLFILACIISEILLFMFAPDGWIVAKSTIRVFGLVWIVADVIFIPGLIVRLLENNKGGNNE